MAVVEMKKLQKMNKLGVGERVGVIIVSFGRKTRWPEKMSKSYVPVRGSIQAYFEPLFYGLVAVDTKKLQEIFL